MAKIGVKHSPLGNAFSIFISALGGFIRSLQH